MNRSSLLRALCARLLFALVLVAAYPANAHELRPAIADMTINEDRVSLSVALNLEAVIAGIGADHDDTDDAPEAAAYDALRGREPTELREAFESFESEFLSQITLRADDQALEPTVADVVIPEVGDTDLARESVVTLDAVLPDGAEDVTVGWDDSLGPLILRAPGKSEPYSAYLTGGTLSDPIPVTGAEARGTLEIVKDYIVLGFEHILPKGLDHILFVVGLFLLSARLRPLLWQVTSFTVAALPSRIP